MLANPADTASLSHRFRSRRDVALKALIAELSARHGGSLRVIDLGGGAAYWQRIGFDWLQANGVSVLCINYEESELTRDSVSGAPVTIAVGDACALPQYADDSFDFVHSNSVIEHVGRWRDMENFAGEVRRLAPAYYIQTPYFWFPLDPHFYRVPFIHWLPASLRLSLLRRVRAGWSAPPRDVSRAMRLVDSNVMLDKRQFTALFSDADFSWERVAGLPKSMIAMRRART